MLEIKLIVSLDETTKSTLDRLINVLSKEEEPVAKKKVKAPIKATAAPVEEAAEEAVTPKIEVQQVVTEEVKESTKTNESITIEELRILLASAKREKGTDAIKAILKSYGVSLLSDLDPSHYADVAQKVREL